MKSCPTCNRTYSDNTITFCLVDGTILSAPYDPEATQRIPESRSNDVTLVENFPNKILPDNSPPLKTLPVPAKYVPQVKAQPSKNLFQKVLPWVLSIAISWLLGIAAMYAMFEFLRPTGSLAESGLSYTAYNSQFEFARNIGHLTFFLVAIPTFIVCMIAIHSWRRKIHR
jgi:hypothetical protein